MECSHCVNRPWLFNHVWKKAIFILDLNFFAIYVYIDKENTMIKLFIRLRLLPWSILIELTTIAPQDLSIKIKDSFIY